MELSHHFFSVIFKVTDLLFILFINNRNISFENRLVVVVSFLDFKAHVLCL